MQSTLVSLAKPAAGALAVHCTFSAVSLVDRLSLQDTAKYKEALEMFEKVLAGQTRALGSDHPSTLDTLENVAIVLETQGKLKEAILIEEKVVVGRNRVLGAEHPQSVKAKRILEHFSSKLATASGR